MSQSIKRIAIITSGGDAPGMNAALRAVVLTANHLNIDVYGFTHGFNGLIFDEYRVLREVDVRHLIHRGGTLLKSARCLEFKTNAGARKVADTLRRHDIDCLIIIGGDGSFRGGLHLAKFWTGNIIGIPGTIDNDIDGTDKTIGFATAVDTACDAIDKIRDTADAFERIFLVEVMGRQSSFIAMHVGIACAAEQILTFETHDNPQSSLADMVTQIVQAKAHRGKSSYIIVVAENLWPGGSQALARKLSDAADIDCQACVLGYIQRGGRPVAEDRILATKLGVAAVEAAVTGANMVMVGTINKNIELVPLDITGAQQKQIDPYLFRAQQLIFDFEDRE